MCCLCLSLSVERRIHNIEELQRKDVGQTQMKNVHYKTLMKEKLMVPIDKLF